MQIDYLKRLNNYSASLLSRGVWYNTTASITQEQVQVWMNTILLDCNKTLSGETRHKKRAYGRTLVDCSVMRFRSYEFDMVVHQQRGSGAPVHRQTNLWKDYNRWVYVSLKKNVVPYPFLHIWCPSVDETLQLPGQFVAKYQRPCKVSQK